MAFLLVGCGAVSDITETEGVTKTVRLSTEWGAIEIELLHEQAPVSATNIEAYVTAGAYDGGSFWRTVTPRNDNNPHTVSVIQLQADPDFEGFEPIAHEPTSQTGLNHLRGAVSLARNMPGSATSAFFICIEDSPVLDHGGLRAEDGEGFAVFGRVVSGMDVVDKIWAAKTSADSDDPYMAGQVIDSPIAIHEARLVARAGQ